MLDEGLNIPEIDVAVLVSSSQSKRQRVQRVGRALRKSRHGTRPLIISFFVAETTDANTIQHDRELFSAVARICQVNADGLLDKLKEFPQ
jgi:RNA polymerase primary sigma factor